MQCDVYSEWDETKVDLDMVVHLFQPKTWFGQSNEA
jgi:hypothetical protein